MRKFQAQCFEKLRNLKLRLNNRFSVEKSVHFFIIPTQGKLLSFSPTYVPGSIRNEDSTIFSAMTCQDIYVPRYKYYFFDQEFLNSLILAVLIYEVFNSSRAQQFQS